MIKRPKLLDRTELTVERIYDNPNYAAIRAELTALEKRRVLTEQRRNRARARLRGVKPSRSVSDRALDLVKGGRVDATDPAAEIEAADQEEMILLGGIIEKTRQLDELSRDLSYEVSQRVKAQHDAALLAALQALTDLHAALDAAAAIRARLYSSGYRPSSVLLPDVRPPVAFGDPEYVGSDAWRFAQVLVRTGIING